MNALSPLATQLAPTCCTPSSSTGMLFVPPPKPVWLPPLWPGEIDGRYINCAPDLGPFGDSFTGIQTLSLTIVREDGQAITVNDLQQAGVDWPNTLDTTGLIPTFGLHAPLGSADTTYILTLMANKTAQNRLFVRYLFIQVAPWAGANPKVPPPLFAVLINNNGILFVSDPNWPISPIGLPLGAVWSNGGLVMVIPGLTPDPTAPPVYFGQITSTELLLLGGGNLPMTPPAAGSLQLWNNGGIVFIA